MRARTVGMASVFRRSVCSIFSEQGVDLALLNIDKDQARQPLVPGEIKFPHKIGLHGLNSQNDKGSQANSQQNYPGLIPRPVHAN